MSSPTLIDRTGLALVAGAASMWGLWSLVLRPTGLPSAVTSPMLFIFMGLAALPWALRAAPVRWDRVTLLLLAGNIACDAINVVTFFAAMDRTTVQVAVLTHYLAPILVALGAPWIDRQQVPGAVPAALVATIGLTLVLEPWNAGDGVLVGGALGAISAFAYAGNVFVVRRLAPRIGVARVISLHSLGAALVLAPLAAGGLAAVSADDLTRLIGGSLILGALAGAMFVRGLSRIGSARASVLTFLEPMVACVVGGLYWHEPVGRLAILGALLIIAAGIHVARAPHRLGAGGTVA